MYEIPDHPDIKLFNPEMSYFIEMSLAVTRIHHKYVPTKTIHV